MDLSETNPNNKNRHPWELSRAESLLGLSDIINPSPHPSLQFADIGTGDLFFTYCLAQRHKNKIYAVEPNIKSDINHNQIELLKNTNNIPDNSIDILFLLDVLEHIENQDVFLQNLLTKLKPSGKIIITVPAFQFLFSGHDSFLNHYRRYSKKSLCKTINKHPLEVMHCFYFYHTLFWYRLFQKIISLLLFKTSYSKAVSRWKYPKNHLLTKVIRFILNIDFKLNFFLSKIGIHIGGLSLCLVAKKKSV